MSNDFQVSGNNAAAPFTLKLHRGDGMVLIAMNWRNGTPPEDFVGFAIEYKEPKSDRFKSVRNRLSFPAPDGAVNATTLSSRLSPIQKFRWVQFPFNADLDGPFIYRVTPVFMDDSDVLSYGEAQEAAIELRRDTYPEKLNVTFTRGFVSSQAFVDKYGGKTPKETKELLSRLMPAKADDGLKFVANHPKAEEALKWMGFEARSAVLEVLDKAIEDNANVYVVAYDLSEREFVSRLEKLGTRLRIIIDDSGDHGEPHSGETQSAERLAATAGEENVKRQRMRKLQHNKTIVVDGPTVKAVVCGSTNFSWRGFFVQANNAIILSGESAVKPFLGAFKDYWDNDDAEGFGVRPSAEWTELGLDGINAKVAFSPHSSDNALLETVADDIDQTTSNLFYSLAFLHQTKGPIRDAIERVSESDDIFVYGISDKDVGGLDLQKPDGNIAPVFPEALTENVPEPFKSEPTGLAGNFGNRMHHKFVVIDFDKPTARVYMGSYNFSSPADLDNGENLLLIRDRRIAVSYVVEALRIFDHYHFRIAQVEAATAQHKLVLAKPPREGEEPWWADDYTDTRRIRDRELFA